MKKKITPTKDAARTQKLARTSTTQARKLATPPYVRPDQVPWGTPGSSTKRLPTSKRGGGAS